MAGKHKCPICSKPASPGGEHYPFCCERCRTIDLGNWSSGSYVISRPLTEAEQEDAGRPASHEDGLSD